MTDQSKINWARIFKLPLQIVMMGISIFIVAKLFTYLGLHPISWPSKETGSDKYRYTHHHNLQWEFTNPCPVYF
jgi:hypothetical protein